MESDRSMLVDVVVVGLSDGLADPVLDAVVDVGRIRQFEEEICVGDGDAKGGWWRCDAGEGERGGGGGGTSEWTICVCAVYLPESSLRCGVVSGQGQVTQHISVE